MKYNIIILLALFPIIISAQPVFADTSFVSLIQDSSVPGCEKTFTCFSPYTINISVGDTVFWSNDDSAAHTVTSGTISEQNNMFDSSLFMSGDTFSHTFNNSGEFDYFCMVHPWMVGVVKVSSFQNPPITNTATGVTPRGTPIPLDERPTSVGGYTTYYNDEWEFSIDVPNDWIIDDSPEYEEGWEKIVFLTPDPEYWSTYVGIEYYFDDYTYQGLYGNSALEMLESNVEYWCNNTDFNLDGFSCYNFETVQTEVLDETYLISYTFTTREYDGTIFEKYGALAVIPLSDSEYVSVDIEIDYDNFELRSQEIGYILTSFDYSEFLTPTSSTSTQPEHVGPFGDLNTRSYHNDEFGFSIDYPSGWYIDDELLIDDDWYGIVAFSSDFESLDYQWFDVAILYDDYDYRGISDSQYMSQLIEELEIGCTDVSMQYDGYTCSNFEISDKLTERFTDNDGNEWYGVYYSYTENYPQNETYDIALAHFELPQGDDTWILTFYFDLDSYDEYLGIGPIDFVDEIGASFNIDGNVVTEDTTQKEELTCGPGTAPKDGQCVRIEMDSEEEELTCGPGTAPQGGQCVRIEIPGEEDQCLIATASYGSELAPQVQMLREIRDNSLLETNSGAAFMSGFNAIYYSFAPTIAQWENENIVFKEVVRTTITPLIASLSLLQYVSMDSEAEVLVYGISLIVLNLAMYIGIPASVIIGIRFIKES